MLCGAERAILESECYAKSTTINIAGKDILAYGPNRNGDYLLRNDEWAMELYYNPAERRFKEVWGWKDWTWAALLDSEYPVGQKFPLEIAVRVPNGKIYCLTLNDENCHPGNALRVGGELKTAARK